MRRFFAITGLIATILAALTARAAGQASAPASREAGEAVVLFDGGEAPSARNATVAVAKDDEGKAYLVAKAKDANARLELRWDLPAGTDLSTASALTAAIRVAGARTSLTVRWCALDANGRVIRQRRLDVAPRAGMQESNWPLYLWRWGDQSVGGWDEVRAIVLRAEDPVQELRLAAVRFAGGDRGGASAQGPQGWLMQAAFEGRKFHTVALGPMTAASDADEMSDDDLRRLAGNMNRVAAWAHRTMPRAWRPLNDGGGASMLVFGRRVDWENFYERLGRQWSVAIPRPASGGYTVQDIAGSSFDANAGHDRAVYFHEGVHAVLARHVRLLEAAPTHAWLQEGMANYLQLCVYPASLKGGTYGRRFGEGLDANSFFRPLSELVAAPCDASRYAQLASIIAFLVEEHGDWLDRLAAGAAAGTPIDATLRECGTTLDELQSAWLAWGRGRFPAASSTAASAPAASSPFEKPKEWKAQ